MSATLPVAARWSCHRSAECCRLVPHVTMTREEQAVVAAAAAALDDPPALRWQDHVKAGFVQLEAGPCPLLGGTEGAWSCRIHAARPYSCRRFGCLRPDPSVEPLVPDRSVFGAVNVSRRVAVSRVARRQYARLQRKAQRWALAHGWGEKDHYQKRAEP